MTHQQALEYIRLAAERVIPIAELNQYQEACKLLLQLVNPKGGSTDAPNPGK